jgi:hypothetical protein
LAYQSVFTKKSKLSEHSIGKDILKNDEKRFKKYVNEIGN